VGVERFQIEGVSYGGHGNLALEAAADGIVNTLGLAPRGSNTLEPVRLVTVEAVGACYNPCQSFQLCNSNRVELYCRKPFGWTSPFDRGTWNCCLRMSIHLFSSLCRSHFQSLSSFFLHQCSSCRRSVERRCYPGQRKTGTVGIREHTLLDDRDVLLGGDHLEKEKSSVSGCWNSEDVRFNSLCRCCVSPGVEGCRVGAKSISKTSHWRSGRPTLVHFQRPKRTEVDYVSLGLAVDRALPRFPLWDFT